MYRLWWHELLGSVTLFVLFYRSEQYLIIRSYWFFCADSSGEPNGCHCFLTLSNEILMNIPVYVLPVGGWCHEVIRFGVRRRARNAVTGNYADRWRGIDMIVTPMSLWESLSGLWRWTCCRHRRLSTMNNDPWRHGTMCDSNPNYNRQYFKIKNI